jgi:hypothetical protein
LGKIVARNKNLLQGIIGFGRAILADTLPLPHPNEKGLVSPRHEKQFNVLNKASLQAHILLASAKQNISKRQL